MKIQGKDGPSLKELTGLEIFLLNKIKTVGRGTRPVYSSHWGQAMVGVAVEESRGLSELATIPFAKVVRISVVELNAISHPWFRFGEISQMGKVNSSTVLHPAWVKSLCEQRGDGPPIFSALQLQKEKLPPPALKTWWMWTLSAISRIWSETTT